MTAITTNGEEKNKHTNHVTLVDTLASDILTDVLKMAAKKKSN